MKLTLDYPPGVNTLYGVRAIIENGALFRVLGAVLKGLPIAEAAKQLRKAVMAFPYKTKEHEAYRKHAVAVIGRLDPMYPRPHEVALEVRLYRPRRAGDIDGPLKTLLDVMQGLVYENDDQISRLLVERDDDKNRPRVEVTIEPRNVEGHQATLDALLVEDQPPRRAGAVVTEHRVPTQREIAAKATTATISFRRPTAAPTKE